MKKVFSSQSSKMNLTTKKQLSFDFQAPNHLKTTTLAWKGIVDKSLPVTPFWLGDFGFENFLKDMGERPEGAILVRINKNKIFCKSNCKWINWREYALLNRKIPVSRFAHIRVIRLENGLVA